MSSPARLCPNHKSSGMLKSCRNPGAAAQKLVASVTHWIRGSYARAQEPLCHVPCVHTGFVWAAKQLPSLAPPKETTSKGQY